MRTMFLQEVDATVLVADVRDFSPLAAQLGPVELGLALGRFYEHIGEIVERHRGRIVKFLGDGVLVVFVGPAAENRKRALATVADAIAARQPFLDENEQQKLPLLDYALGVASGMVLAGELGTEKLRFYDVLGQPVNHAFRLTALATRRGGTNLVDAGTFEGAPAESRPAGSETDPVEVGGDTLRLFQIEK